MDGTTGGRCQAAYAIREYHHMLKLNFIEYPAIHTNYS